MRTRITNSGLELSATEFRFKLSAAYLWRQAEIKGNFGQHGILGVRVDAREARAIAAWFNRVAKKIEENG